LELVIMCYHRQRNYIIY